MGRRLRAAGLGLLGVALAASAGPGLAASATAAPRLTAVLTLQPGSSLARTFGADVLAELTNVDALVVRGNRQQLDSIARDTAVRSMAPDYALQVTGDDSTSGAPAVAAATGLGGKAGKDKAGAGVVVAVVDTGVSDTAALSRSTGRIIDGTDTSGSGTLTDAYGHGTAMAGLVAGGAVSSTVLGVAPGASILNVKVAGADGSTSLSKVLAGLDWLVGNRSATSVDVASISLAAQRPEQGYLRDPLTDAVDSVRKAGITVVAAVGNTAGQAGDPGFSPSILSVGAVDLVAKSPAVAPFSGSANVHGIRRPDLVASGVGVLTLLPAGSTLAKANAGTRRADGLWRSNGTSQSTAITAGAAALLLADYPSATPDDVRASLMKATVGFTDDPASGVGSLRAAKKLVTGTAYDGTNSGGTGQGASPETAASSWSASSWSASSWSASSWSASSWSASSWSASSWSASSWSASSWSASSWSASSWSAGSWSAGSWS